MLEATLLRAVEAVKAKILTADEKATGWLVERDRRRRQLAAFLRGIVRSQGSQRKAALVTGMSQSVISRILDAEGYKKKRASDAAYDAGNRNPASPADDADDDGEEGIVKKTNVVDLRKKRPDWKPSEPRRNELHKWYQQYLGWTKSAQTTARQFIFNAKGLLPEEAYYDNQSADGNSAVGSQKRPATRATRTRVGNLSAS